MKYAGIGARDTPSDVLQWMSQIGAYLGRRDYLLRSGGAHGADSAFFRGCESVKGAREIFLPWNNYNDLGIQLQREKRDGPTALRGDFAKPTEAAMSRASKSHPSWNNCNSGARKLHARNAHILFGLNLDDPVDFILCWTKRGAVIGGTGQALRMSKSIPIFNLARLTDRNLFRDLMNKREQQCLKKEIESK